MKRLIYINPVNLDEICGQSIFEKQHIESIIKHLDNNPEFTFKVFSVENKNEDLSDKRIEFIPLNKSSYFGYLHHQLLLLIKLGRYLLKHRQKEICVYFRYNPSMLAPLLLSYLFKFRMTLRTGPILPNLHIYKKNPGFIIFHGIKLILGLYYQKASAIIVVTEKIKQWVIETYPFTKNKTFIVPNGANTDIFFPSPPDRKRWGLPENEIVAGFVSHIHKDYGIDTILNAMAILKEKKLPSPHLMIVGDGPELKKLQDTSKRLGVSGMITWTGQVPHKDVPSAINSCDLMLAPFTKKLLEVKGPSTIKLFEYLACDKPVYATRDYHKFIEDHHLGKLVELDNVELWAQELEEATKNTPKLDGRGVQYVANAHSFDILASRIRKISLGQGDV